MTILTGHSFEFISHSAEQTRRLGMRMGSLLKPGMLVCLQGDLGAGKTTFVQGVAAGWGSTDQVSSPTFQLVNEYRRIDPVRLYHLDTYRLNNILEAEELDVDGMLANGPTLVEWPELMSDIFPDDRLWITINYIDETKRSLAFSSTGKASEALLLEFRDRIKGN